MITYENTYWNSKGKYQLLADALQKKIPTAGEVSDAKKNPALERFRNAMNCYYDLYNNGLGNRSRYFSKVFGFGASQYKFRDDYSQVMYNRTESAFDEIIMAAAAEQLNKV
jgi:hypothetical protein